MSLLLLFRPASAPVVPVVAVYGGGVIYYNSAKTPSRQKKHKTRVTIRQALQAIADAENQVKEQSAITKESLVAASSRLQSVEKMMALLNSLAVADSQERARIDAASARLAAVTQLVIQILDQIEMEEAVFILLKMED